MQRRAALQVVLGRRLVVVHLFAAENETLLLWWNALLLLDSFLYLLHLVVRLDVEFDLFTREGTDFDLHICVAMLICLKGWTLRVSKMWYVAVVCLNGRCC